MPSKADCVITPEFVLLLRVAGPGALPYPRSKAGPCRPVVVFSDSERTS
jgi:hypothetical protein